MLGAFAEFERNMIKARQAEGIKKAKEEGKFKGKQPTIDHDLIIELSLRKVSPDVIAEALILVEPLCSGLRKLSYPI